MKKRGSHPSHWIIATLVLMAMLAMSFPAFAQTDGESAEDADAGTDPGTEQIEETIVVTATRRAESVQRIPVAVSVVSGDDLAKAGVSDTRGLVGLAPSFFLTSSSSEVGGTTARIRGIGTQGNNPGLESAVGMYVDGVYRNRSGVGLTDLGQVERVEILRGPQGTLFGRNSSAGVLSVITQRPQLNQLAGYAELTAGNYGLIKANAGLDGPFSERAGGRLDVTFEERDGFFERDALTGEDFNTHGRYGVRGQLMLFPSSKVSVRLIADGAWRDESCCSAMYTLKGARTSVALESIDPTTVLTSDTNDVFGRVTYTTPGRNADTEVAEYGVSGEVTWDLENSMVTSITSYRDWDAKNGGDLDYSGADILYRNPEDLAQVFETFTQEVRWSGKTDSVDWLVGFFYSQEDLDFRLGTKAGADYSVYSENLIDLFGGPAPAPDYTNINGQDISIRNGDGADDRFRTESTSFALFTHNTWSMSDRTRATLGLRYTNEEKDFSGTVRTTGTGCANFLTAAGFSGNGSPIVPVIFGSSALTGIVGALNCLGGTLNSTLDGSYADSRSEDNLSGTLKLTHDIGKDDLIYGSFSRGYKAGGYNLDRSGLDPNGVLDATATTSRFFDIRTDVNALEFEAEEVDAFELGLKSTLAGGRMNLNLSAFYQDFTNFQLNTFNGLTFFVVTLDEVISQGVELDYRLRLSNGLRMQAGYLFNKAEYADDLKRSDGLPTTNLAGQQLTHAPKHSFTLAGTYSRDLNSFGGLSAFAHLDMRWTDRINTGSDLDEEKIQDAYTVANVRFGFGSRSRSWTVELWANNVLDEEYLQLVFDSPIQNTSGNQVLESYSAFLGEPRTAGVTVGFRF